MRDIQKEAEILGLIVDILDHIRERKINTADLSDPNDIIPKGKNLIDASFQIVDMEQGEQLIFQAEEKEIVTCLVLLGNVVIGAELYRLERSGSEIFNNEVLYTAPCKISARAACQSKLLLISTK